ncbi:MAG: YtxH domain-containing protein [Thermomicrobiales bacterium]
MIKREESRHDFAFMAGVVIGAVSGALATLALAPRTGTETRDRWRERMQDMPVDDVKARAASLREVAAAKTGQLREAASSKSPGEVVQSTRSKVTELVDRSPLPVTLGDEHDDAGRAALGRRRRCKDAASDLASAAEAEADHVIDETTSRASDDNDDKSST